MSTKAKACLRRQGFIALVSAVVISSVLLAALFGAAAAITQYNQTVDQRLQSIQKWIKTKENLERNFMYGM